MTLAYDDGTECQDATRRNPLVALADSRLVLLPVGMGIALRALAQLPRFD
jgi:hypothetical protein